MLFLAAFLILPLVVAAINVTTTNLRALFGSSLSSGAEIFYPSWTNWTEDVQQRWSSYQAPSYIGAIKVATVADVQQIVKIATRHNIPFLATAAGHGVASTYEGLHDGIDIDLSNLRYAHLDAGKDLVTIGGATLFQEIWDVLYAAGKEIQTGAAQCVGSVGATLGAGIGPLQGHRGLMIDALESVKLVTATGDLITASKTENADLFWGIRGAGWNFGIITEATYQVYNATNNGQVLEGDLLLPASANRSVWEILRKYDTDLPDILSLTTAISYNATADTTTITINVIYYGPEADAQPYLQPFFDLNPLHSNFTVVPWNKLYATLFFGADVTSCLDNQHLLAGGVGLRYTDVDTFESYFNEFTAFYRQYPEVTASVVFSRFPTDAILAVPDEETAYPYRDISTHILFENIYPDNTTLNQAIYDFLVASRITFTKTSGYDNLTLYNNYGHGDEGPEVWYSPAKLPRLAALKKEWDPQQLFSWYNPLPLQYP